MSEEEIRKACADNAHYGSDNPKKLGQMCAPCAEYNIRRLTAQVAALQERVKELEDKAQAQGIECMKHEDALEADLARVTGDRDTWSIRAEAHRQAKESCEKALEAERARAKGMEEAKNGAYSERNKLVAALSKIFPAWLEDHDAADTAWENDWRNIVFITLPTGQASWHLHDSELPMFSHLSRLCGNSWDGHTTEQKYERLASLSPSPANNPCRPDNPCGTKDCPSDAPAVEKPLNPWVVGYDVGFEKGVAAGRILGPAVEKPCVCGHAKHDGECFFSYNCGCEAYQPAVEQVGPELTIHRHNGETVKVYPNKMWSPTEKPKPAVAPVESLTDDGGECEHGVDAETVKTLGCFDGHGKKP